MCCYTREILKKVTVEAEESEVPIEKQEEKEDK